jgi:hypothetical protein
LFFCSTVSAQEVAVDTAKQKTNKYLPTGVRVGTDVLALGISRYDNTFDGWEVSGDVDFDRYYFVMEFGYWAKDFVTDADVYSNDGRYFRVGADVNFLTKDPDKNMFFLGLRYARSTFSENLSIARTDSLWNTPINNSYTNNSINGSWFEVTSGIRVKIWKMFWMGYTARFKFALNTNETGDLIPHDIPGYGTTDKDSAWGFNYQIFLRIPVRKQK